MLHPTLLLYFFYSNIFIRRILTEQRYILLGINFIDICHEYFILILIIAFGGNDEISSSHCIGSRDGTGESVYDYNGKLLFPANTGAAVLAR